MAATIVAYDIPGSSYTGFIGNNYRKERAVRRFLVDGNGRKDKTTVLEDVIAAIDDDADLNLHIQTVAANANLPLQEATIQRVDYIYNPHRRYWHIVYQRSSKHLEA